MATYPYRFECDLTIEEEATAEPTITPDPTVRVYVGETYTNDNTGEKKINKQDFRVVGVKLSNLEEFLTVSVTGIPAEILPVKITATMDVPMVKLDKEAK